MTSNAGLTVRNNAGVACCSTKEVGLNRNVVGVGNAQAVVTIAADYVVIDEGFVNKGAANQRVVVGAFDDNAILQVTNGACAVVVGADEITAQYVVFRGLSNFDTIEDVTGNQIALRWADINNRYRAFVAGGVVGLLGGAVVIGSATNGVIGGGCSDQDAVAIVTNECRTRTVCANEVCLNDVARAAIDFDTGPLVTGEKVGEIIGSAVRVGSDAVIV